MLKYKTSDLLKRSRQLADLEGSDFISWNESINCINESYIGLYEKLIAMGDNSYVKDFHCGIGETELPADFWQLKGIYLWNNGNLQTVNRRADNTSIHFTSYELKNGKLIVNGSNADIYVEYFPKPMSLFYPPADKEISLDIPEGVEVLDCCGHTFLYKITDEEQQEHLGIYDLDGLKSYTDTLIAWTENKTFITKDYVFSLVEGGLDIFDIALGDSNLLEPGTIPLVTESGDLFLVQNGEILDMEGNSIKTIESVENAFYYVSDNDFNDIFCLVDNDNVFSIYHNGIPTNQTAKKIIYSENKCYFLSYSKLCVIADDEVKTIKAGIGAPIGFIGINQNTGYGYASKKYNKYWVCAYCEDTPLDFPNSFHYQILSYLLAISFRCKQGADISLLNSQLAMVSQTFEETLGSDDFQFTRMGNVY